MNGGQLKQKIKFFDFGKISDGAGGFTTGGLKVLILDTLASVKQIKASRTAENLQETINSVYEIKLRQRAGFMPKSDYIVEWDGKVCEITGFTEDIEKGSKFWLITVVSNPALIVNPNPGPPVIADSPYTFEEFNNLPPEDPYTVPEYLASNG